MIWIRKKKKIKKNKKLMQLTGFRVAQFFREKTHFFLFFNQVYEPCKGTMVDFIIFYDLNANDLTYMKYLLKYLQICS